MVATDTYQPATLLRRLGAILYDCLLLLAIEMLAGALWLPVFGNDPINTHPLRHIYQLSLLMVALTFFIGFWFYGGQTLGMRAWRLRLQGADGHSLQVRQLAIRFAVAALSWLALGLGFWWSLIDPQRRTWHDIASGTILIHEPSLSSARR